MYRSDVAHEVAFFCSVLQCVAASCSVLQCDAVCWSVLQCVAVCCSVMYHSEAAPSCAWRSSWIAIRGSPCGVALLWCVAVCYSVLQCVAVFLQCVTVESRSDGCHAAWCAVVCCKCCSVLQYVAVCYSMLKRVEECLCPWFRRYSVITLRTIVTMIVYVAPTHSVQCAICVIVCCSVLQCVAVCYSML